MSPRVDKAFLRALIGEFLCTFIFMITLYGAALNNLGGTLVTGFVAIAIIYTFGSISGAHFNPAVTISAVLGGKIDLLKGVLYVVLQVAAGVAAAATLRTMYSSESMNDLVMKPNPDASPMSALLMEFILTFILVFVIYAVAWGVRTSAPADLESADEFQAEMLAANKQRLLFAPIAIGLTLGFLCSIGGGVSGGAFNPAVPTGIALLAWDLKDLWVYWVGDLLGGVAAALLYTFVLAE